MCEEYQISVHLNRSVSNQTLSTLLNSLFFYYNAVLIQNSSNPEEPSPVSVTKTLQGFKNKLCTEINN